MRDTTDNVLSEVADERVRQDEKWGEQNHPDGTSPALAHFAIKRRLACQRADQAGNLTWRHIADEEYAEACAETDPAKLRTELVQLAAVLVAWVEAIDRRPAAPVGSESLEAGR